MVTYSSLSTCSIASSCALFAATFYYSHLVHILRREPHSLRHCCSASRSSLSHWIMCRTWHSAGWAMSIASGRETCVAAQRQGCPMLTSSVSSLLGEVTAASICSKGNVPTATSVEAVVPLAADAPTVEVISGATASAPGVAPTDGP
jgi:hypothetical protein